MKTVIAVDLDDVLAIHAEAFIAFSNSRYGTNLTVEDYSDHWSEIWQVDKEEREKRADELYFYYPIASRSVIAGADQVLKRLAKNYRLVVVTARSNKVSEPTNLWINQYFKGLFKEIHFVNVLAKEKPLSKAKICSQIGAKYLIDDSSIHCVEAAKAVERYFYERN